MRPLLANFITRLVLALLLTSVAAGIARATPPNTILGSVAVCDPNSPQSCAAPLGGALPVTGTFSATLGGFAPVTTGTPIAVTTGGVTGTLPVGVVVAAFNVGTTNTAFCKLGASATTSDIAIPPQSWFAYTVGASTQLTCITSTSTTTVNMVGGSGLPTGAGGGGGGGGGSSAITTWAGGTLGAMANYGTSPGAVLVPGFNAFITNTPAVSQSGTWNFNNITGTVTLPTGASTSANQTSQITQETATATALGTTADAVCGSATGTCSLVSLQKFNNATSPVLGAGSAIVGKVGIDQTTPGTTNNVSVSYGAVALVADPCQQVATVRTPISVSTAANIKIVTGTSSKKTHICGMLLFSAGTTNVGIVEGSGVNCGTSTLGLIGGATAATGPNLTAQAGFVSAPAGYAVASTTVNANDICLINGSAIQVSGYIVTATP